MLRAHAVVVVDQAVERTTRRRIGGDLVERVVVLVGRGGRLLLRRVQEDELLTQYTLELHKLSSLHVVSREVRLVWWVRWDRLLLNVLTLCCRGLLVTRRTARHKSVDAPGESQHQQMSARRVLIQRGHKQQ